MMQNKKVVPLLLITCFLITGCNVKSSDSISENTSNELTTNVTSVSDENFSVNDLEAIESSCAISENSSYETPAKNTIVSDEIFIDNAEYLNNYNENEFRINSEMAMADLIDLLIEAEKWQDNYKLICSGMVTLECESYYQITLSTENSFSYSDVGTFWINADSGMIYLRYDPTLDTNGYFSEFAINISEDDYRTRLILLS